MAIERKLNEGYSPRRAQVATKLEGATVRSTITETYSGPYAELRLLQDALASVRPATSLQPDQAGNAILTATREETYSPSTTEEPPPPVIEVLWQELRLPVEQNPAFDILSPAQKKAVRAAAESEAGQEPEDINEKKLYLLLAAGTTEYSTGVPVVRRTSTKRTGDEGGGGAWFRDTPPGSIPPGYEWLKTADERRSEDGSFTLVEEWTGATVWDPDLYPATS